MDVEDANAMLDAREAEEMEAVDKQDIDVENTSKILSGYYEQIAKDAEAAEKDLEIVEEEYKLAEERYESTHRDFYKRRLQELEEDRRRLRTIINKRDRELGE